MPSVWLNSNPCDQSSVSFLKNFPTEKYFPVFSFTFLREASVFAERQVVCVLIKTFFASSSFQGYCQPRLPPTPDSCAFFTFFTFSFLGRVPLLFLIKKVSCISLAGWSCGVNSASKTQKEVSVIGPDISLNPISSQISFPCLMAWLTKWRFPPDIAGTGAERSYFLNFLPLVPA